MQNTIIRLEEGEPIPFFVTVLSNPPANFTWMKENFPQNLATAGNIMMAPNEYFDFLQDSNASATVTKEMAGIWKVVSCNEFGCAASLDTTLIVECK